MNTNIEKIKPSGIFTNYIFKSIPLAFDESLSYYETLCGLLAYLKDTVIPTVNNNAEAVIELQELYVQLKEYVDNYFKSIDFQKYVNEKLDELVEDGTLERIINQQIFSEKVNTYNQDSVLSRIFRTFNSTNSLMDSVHYYNENYFISESNGTNSVLYKYDSNFNLIGNTTLNFIITDISDYNNNLVIVDNTSNIKFYDVSTLIENSSLDIEYNVSKIERYNDKLILISNNQFYETTDFTTITSINLNYDVDNFTIYREYFYLLKNDTISIYNPEYNFYRYLRLDNIIDNAYIKGITNCLCLKDDEIIIGSYKKSIPIRDEYCFSLYKLNTVKNTKRSTTQLNYNSMRNEFEIYYDSSNTSVNPDGTIDNPYSNFNECIEVALNGDYNKGNIMFKNSGEELSDVFISDMYKKCGLYFNGATVHGLLIRNSNKIELNNVTIDDEYLTDSCCLEIINGDVVLTDTVTINNTKSLENVVECAFHSNLVCLNPITTGNILSRTGSVVITRNNSLYDKKKINDRYSKFLPNYIELEPTNLTVGTPYTIDDLTLYSTLTLRINSQTQFHLVDIPSYNGTYNIPTCFTHKNNLYVGNLNVTISGNVITVNSRNLYNITENKEDTELTFRINNIFGRC